MTPRLRILSGDDLTTVLATLDQPYAIRWSAERLDKGTGEFTIPHDSPVLQGSPGLLAGGNIVQVRDDTTTLFDWVIRRRQRTRGDVWDPIQVVGDGTLSLCDQALVYQAGGLEFGVPADERIFGWQSPDYDDSAWLSGDGLYSHGTQEEPLSTNLVGYPEGWPDPQAEWLWTQAPTGDGSPEDPYVHPSGTCLFRRTLEVPADAGGRVRLFWSVANSGVAYFDSAQVGEHSNYRTFQQVDLEILDSTDHVLAFLVENQAVPAGFTGQNIGGLLYTIVRINDDDTLGPVIYRSFTPAVIGSTGAPGPNKGLDYPDPIPGVTPGFILATLMDEAQARGWFSAVTRDFTAAVDSNGVAWPTEIEFGCQVGDDTLLSVADRLRDVGVYVRMAPGFILQAYASTVDLTATVQVGLDEARELQTETEDDLVDVLLIRSQEDWIEASAEATPVPRREAFLSLGLTPTASAAVQVATETLNDFTSPRQVVRWVISGVQETPQPMVAYLPGDLISAPWLDPASIAGAWVLASMLVDTINGQVDETGDLDYVHETSPV